jgi:chromosome condensin MukBEF MukE localization factor
MEILSSKPEIEEKYSEYRKTLPSAREGFFYLSVL